MVTMPPESEFVGICRPRNKHTVAIGKTINLRFSLGFLEFLFELEEHFGINIEQEDAKHVQTIRDLGRLIDQLVANAAAKPS